MHKREVEVCFSPKLYDLIKIKVGYITVIVDILRATTSICTAIEYGAKSIIPVATVEEAKKMKIRGYLVAAEREGEKLDFADYGNSAFNFMDLAIQGKTIAYTTTNGVQAVLLSQGRGEVVIGAFSNFSVLYEWLLNQQKNIVILCSGWKGDFCMEDALFAGALSSELLNNSRFRPHSDATNASISLWRNAKNNLSEYIEEMSHVNRLRKLNQGDSIPYSFCMDTCSVIPILDNGQIIKLI